MPVSTTIHTTKTKSLSEQLCDDMDSLIAEAQSQVEAYANICTDLDVEPDLLKQAMSKKLGSEENRKQIATDMNNWKAEVKGDVKTAVDQKKSELKQIRKERRQNLQATQPELSAQTAGKKKSRGGFI
jgi:hypothetical protein